jgi:hypothetical protein
VYKALWMCSDRVAALFPDGTLVVFTARSVKEMQEAVAAANKVKNELTRRQALKAESERQVSAELAKAAVPPK